MIILVAVLSFVVANAQDQYTVTRVKVGVNHVEIDCDGSGLASGFTASRNDQPELMPVLRALRRGDIIEVEVCDNQVLSLRKVGHQQLGGYQGTIYDEQYRKRMRGDYGYGDYGYYGGGLEVHSENFGIATDGYNVGVRVGNCENGASVNIPVGGIVHAIKANKARKAYRKAQQAQYETRSTQPQYEETRVAQSQTRKSSDRVVVYNMTAPSQAFK